MTLADRQGLAVSTDRPETIAAIDTFVDGAMRYTTELGAILPAAAADPTCVHANTLAASLMMWLERGDSPTLARPYLDNARAGLDRATARERAFFAATEAWAGGRADRAVAILEELLDASPRDLFAMRLTQYHYLNRGRFEAMLAVAEKIQPANPENGYLLGCLAFPLEQLNRLQEAETLGRAADALNADDAWAHHAVAHVLDTRGRLDEGVTWMRDRTDRWTHCNSFMRGHNWWHLALYLIDLGRREEALGLYDKEIWGLDKGFSQDQAGAAALLWRLELRGLDVGARWAELGDYVAKRGIEHVQPFLDLHYLFALERAGFREAADEHLRTLAQHAAAAEPADLRSTLTEVALPGAQGVSAYARGEMETAYRALGRARPRLQEIGGSHAQRDVFEQAWLDAALRSGHAAEVVPVLEARAAARPSVPYHAEQLLSARGRPA